MNLLYHEIIHFLSALLAGFLVWKIYQRPIGAFLSGIFAGFLVDLDHFFDYFLAFGFNFRLDYFEKGYQFLKDDKLYIIFHGWEYALIFIILFIFARSASFKTIFLSLALGLLIHLSLDVIIDRVPITCYSIIYRASHNFEIKDLVGAENYQNHLKLKRIINFY
jgi:hypothetical protein